MHNDCALRVLAKFAVQPDGLRWMGGAGGLSGAQFWRVTAGGQELCLRRWPAGHPAPTRLAYIHSVLSFASLGGVQTLPVPRRNQDGQTFVTAEGHLWELSSWLSGSPDPGMSPTRTRIRSAFREVARFHLITGDFPGQSGTGTAAGLRERAEILQSLRAGELNRVLTALRESVWHQPLAPLVERFGPPFWQLSESVQQKLAQAASRDTALQPAIRDLRREHVLFDGERVSGLVDFGALRHDYCGCDIARLIGSWLGDRQHERQQALAAYQEVRPLSNADLELIELVDRANVLVSPTNWFRWLGAERREFEDPSQVIQQLESWVARLEAATEMA